MFEPSSRPAPRNLAWAMAVWALAWTALLALDGWAELANLGLVLVLAAALSGLWLPASVSIAACTVAVLAFNWSFVPPRGTFSVDLRQHAWLLATLWVVGSLVAVLMARQRRLLAEARALAAQAERLRQFSDALRGTSIEAAFEALRAALQALGPVDDLSLVAPGAGSDATLRLGPPADDDESAHLDEALRSGRASEPAREDVHGRATLVLPARAATATPAALLLRFPPGAAPDAEMRATAQALCDQLGLHLERQRVETQARRAEQDAQDQKLRNTLLAAISHDFRTPLATMLGAATSLRDQGDRLSREQARTLADTIATEAAQLAEVAENTLQLARLDAPGVQLSLDWESPEELLGAVARLAAARHAMLRLSVRVEPGLPLLRCDAVLLTQMLSNLVDNAARYGPAGQAIELVARRVGAQLLLAVGDRGPGIDPAARERVFRAFERGHAPARGGQAPRGAGVGLALCRAVAQAHGGSLRVRDRRRGGSFMECLLPVQAQPREPGAAP